MRPRTKSKDPENIFLTMQRQGIHSSPLWPSEESRALIRVIILKLGFAATVNAKAKNQS